MSKIILLGYMGSGKTTIGTLLAEKLSMKFLDLDQHIEKIESDSVSGIFKTKGEIYFRKVENQTFKELLENTESQIISLGGGTPCYANNHLLLEKPEVESVYLKASINVLKERLKDNKQNRPVIKDMNEEEITEFIAKHLFDRSYFYHFAKHIISVDDKNANEIVDEIILKLST